MANNDIISKNIKKQIALNTGQLAITSNNGTTSFVDVTHNNVLGSGANASNYVLSNAPGTYTSNLKAEVYNYAKGIFSGQDVPVELIESLSSLATYYVSKTGSSVQDLFKNGELQPAFLNTVNTFLNSSIQFGYRRLNTNQPWVNNPTLHGNINAAFQPSQPRTNLPVQITTSSYPASESTGSIVSVYETSDVVNTDNTINSNNTGSTSSVSTWVRYLFDSSGTAEHVEDSAIDSTGNIIVVGSATNMGQEIGWITKLENQYGSVLWDKKATLVSGDSSRIKRILIDKSNNIFIAARAVNVPEIITIVKLDINCNVIWQQSINPGGEIQDFVLDEINQYVVVIFNAYDEINNNYIFKFNYNGSLLVSQQISSVTQPLVSVSADFNLLGNLFLVGNIPGSNTIRILIFNTLGNLIDNGSASYGTGLINSIDHILVRYSADNTFCVTTVGPKSPYTFISVVDHFNLDTSINENDTNEYLIGTVGCSINDFVIRDNIHYAITKNFNNNVNSFGTTIMNFNVTASGTVNSYDFYNSKNANATATSNTISITSDSVIISGSATYDSITQFHSGPVAVISKVPKDGTGLGSFGQTYQYINSNSIIAHTLTYYSGRTTPSDLIITPVVPDITGNTAVTFSTYNRSSITIVHD
jgi:hypothetical protein